MDAQVFLAFAVLGVSVVGSSGAGLVWAIRQEGQIKSNKAEIDTLLKEREGRARERHGELMARLDRLETKLDAK
jgi:hypothetical protein